jgi:hypothetical protein
MFGNETIRSQNKSPAASRALTNIRCDQLIHSVHAEERIKTEGAANDLTG